MTRPSARTGFVLGIVGAALYVAGATVIPYASKADSSPGPSTLFGQYLRARSFMGMGTWLAVMVFIFGVALIVLVISIAGLRSERGGRWALGLLGASSIWFLQVLAELVVITRFPIPLSWPGARAMDLGICLGFAGGAIAWNSLRATHHVDSVEGAAPPASAPSAPTGFFLALGGAILYVAVSFLPFSRPTRSAFNGLGLAPSQVAKAIQSHTLARGLLGNGVIGAFQRFPMVYGSALIVGIFAFVGLRGLRQDRCSAALLGAAAAWATAAPIQLFNSHIVRLVGLWGAQLAIGIALIGGIVAVTQNHGPNQAG